MTREALELSWHETAAQVGMPLPNAKAMFRGFCSVYSKPDRTYHNLDHVAVMLDTVSEFEDLLREPLEVRLAVWFHDYVYDSRRQDNEEKSAYLASTILDHERYALLRPRLTELIMATKSHHARWGDPDCQLLLDADLAILGAAPADYDHYAQAIRREYAWVPEDRYREGRRKVLINFLERPRLYHTPALYERLEQAARTNLTCESEALQ